MASLATAAVTGAAFAALYAGHHLGDHAVQSSASAAAKGIPSDDRLAVGVHPWTGWAGCVRHVAAYLVTQAAALALVAVVAPIGWPGAVAALAASGATHAVIDRRWPVRLLIAAKDCQGWPDGPYLLDQSLHIGVLLVAAVLAAAVTDPAGAAVVLAAGVAVLAAGLLVEQRLAHTARHRPFPSDRM